jgi:hypothetical protein
MRPFPLVEQVLYPELDEYGLRATHCQGGGQVDGERRQGACAGEWPNAAIHVTGSRLGHLSPDKPESDRWLRHVVEPHANWTYRADCIDERESGVQAAREHRLLALLPPASMYPSHGSKIPGCGAAPHGRASGGLG